MPVLVKFVGPWALQQMEEGSNSLAHYDLTSKMNSCTIALTLTELWQRNNVKIVIVVGQSPYWQESGLKVTDSVYIKKEHKKNPRVYAPPKLLPNTQKGGNIALTSCKTVEVISLRKKGFFIVREKWNLLKNFKWIFLAISLHNSSSGNADSSRMKNITKTHLFQHFFF